MLAFLPVLLLLLSAATIVALQRFRPGLGYAWLTGSLGSLAAFAAMIFLRWRLPLQLPISNWLPFSTFTDSPIFGLDGSSWPYAFALTAVLAAVMLTASARLSYGVTAWSWASCLVVGAAGLLAVYAANLLTLALAWTLVDLIDLIILSTYSENRSLGVQAVIAFAARVSAMLLTVLSALINRSQGQAPTFANLPTLSALLLLLAVGLRLGVLPLNLPAIPDLRMRRGLGTVLRLSAAASSLVVLARIPALALSPQIAAWLLAAVALGSLYAAAMWLSAADEIAGRPYWLIALAGFAVACGIRGYPRASLAWGIALLLSGVLLFLYSARKRGTLTLPLLGLLGLSGLPFTPTAAGWTGLLTGPFSLWQALLIVAHVLLLLGYLRHAVRPGDTLGDMERWIQVVYPFGLSLVVAAQWLVGTIGWPGSFTLGVWWAAPLAGLGLALGGLAFRQAHQLELAAPAPLRWYRNSAQQAGTFLAALLRLNWLYRLIAALYRRLEQTVQLLTDLLEGDGGLLWVLVLLALFISLVRSRIAP